MDKGFETQIANIEKSTGKSLEEWKAIVNASGLAKHGEMVNFLKTVHGFTHGNANTVVHLARESHADAAENTDDWVVLQYDGKENLKAWYDLLKSEIQSLGTDIEIAPKKGYVSFKRKKQFCIIQPSTKTRMDIGLNIKKTEPSGITEKAGSWNGMCTHRIRIESTDQINQEVFDWIMESYNEAG